MRVNRVIRYGFTGLLLGYTMSLILNKWVWLEMRVTVGLAIHVGLLLGAIWGAFIKKDSKLSGLLIPEILFAICLVVLYGGDLAALTVIPAVLLREGIFLPGMRLQFVNIILLSVLIGGNIVWLFRGAGSFTKTIKGIKCLNPFGVRPWIAYVNKSGGSIDCYATKNLKTTSDQGWGRNMDFRLQV